MLRLCIKNISKMMQNLDLLNVLVNFCEELLLGFYCLITP
ncbi:hypothetical protein PEC301899_10510 [Pectobacterium carotovorum subsp. carotovorum]|nr:hypothetical protein PEC301899_10510 [Pectobacterium carotovorum subsp. carotovorum]GKW23820.1 hypothetical protein PEC311524_14140 [Pectobacterium carotovorum subsp. carotovorum]